MISEADGTSHHNMQSTHTRQRVGFQKGMQICKKIRNKIGRKKKGMKVYEVGTGGVSVECECVCVCVRVCVCVNV